MRLRAQVPSTKELQHQISILQHCNCRAQDLTHFSLIAPLLGFPSRESRRSPLALLACSTFIVFLMV